MATQRLLITGGSGFLGGLLKERLSGEFEVHTLQRSGSGDQKNAHRLDLRNHAALGDAISLVRPDVLVHTAAISDVRLAEENPQATIETNVSMAVRLAEAGCRRGASLVVALSSVKAALPQNTYGLSKALMERCLFRLARNHPDARILSVRLPNILDSPRSFIADWGRMLSRDGLIVTTGYGMERFACTGRAAVEFVAEIIRHKHLLQSGTVAPESRAMRISDALRAFTKAHNCASERRDSGFDTMTKDVMIAGHEVPWTEKTRIGQRTLFHTSPGIEKPLHIDAQVDSLGADFYGADDCDRIIEGLIPS